ncbi:MULTISPECIES: ketose-bisphosphate aldolase [Clostridium]|uniref:ketose-bisphosphate aldolase n=1 Tax=Clostridium TaxID=1485 RepID=UPI00082576BA|nr:MULTISPECIES: ketose-bisphosphate aldolase [Clostridium]PJI06937.1 ketose-bisphosphate aldolase [Clostridium sp. CT7]
MLMNMKDLLTVAKEHKFAVPAFNTSSNMILRGVMEACKEKKAPVIIAIHPDELSFVEDSFIASVKEEAAKTDVPVVIHLDHGGTFEQVLRAIRCGFTSVMIDASRLSFEENIAITQKVVSVAHPLNISVEAELGTIGTTGNGAEEGADKIIYTDPAKAKEFVERTGADTLAIAIGTCHGIYPKNMKPKLRLDLLETIRDTVDIPLVLHGGSANSDDEIEKSAKLGISKINISSDIKDAFYRKCREILTKDQDAREPNAIYPPCIEAMKEVVYHKIDLFDDADKVKYYYNK